MSEQAAWEIVGKRPHHGINVPLFSLRTAQSCGIGEFLDFLPVINWCKNLGLDVIQTLPLNDTGLDSSPYNALSAFALNPLHLSLTALPGLEEDPELLNDLAAMHMYNMAQHIDYVTIRKLKNAFLKRYLAIHQTEIASSRSFQQFVSEHPWLESYARFKELMIRNNWKPWDQWEIRGVDDTLEHKVLQYLCFKQMEQVKKEAQNAGVFIKGDIPILISKQSADVWERTTLFDTSFCAGAPPDYFSRDGQKWGFPLYRWDELERAGYDWWKQRLHVAEKLYHIYRIDHIVGFFRIWAIPMDRLASEGRMIPESIEEAVSLGTKNLQQLLSASSMLPIGEDLGVVPTEVRDAMASLGICGTRVMRWERRWNSDRGFIPVKDYPELSMTTVSTHDSDTLKMWWVDSAADAKDYCFSKGWEYDPLLQPEQQKEILRDSHKSGSLFHINLLQEYFSLFPELSWHDMRDERINVPGTRNERNWSYKFRPCVEEFTQHEGLARLIQELIH